MSYKQIGKIKVLMVVIDFQDARAKDNTGSNAILGRNPVDLGNRINGQPIKIVQDYYDWLIPRTSEFLQTSYYGQLDFDVKLFKNPNAEDGVFTCTKAFYGNDPNDPNHTGYALCGFS